MIYIISLKYPIYLIYRYLIYIYLIYIYTYIHIYTYIYIYTYIHIYIYTYVHIYIFTYIHILQHAISAFNPLHARFAHRYSSTYTIIRFM